MLSNNVSKSRLVVIDKTSLFLVIYLIVSMTATSKYVALKYGSAHLSDSTF